MVEECFLLYCISANMFKKIFLKKAMLVQVFITVLSHKKRCTNLLRSVSSPVLLSWYRKYCRCNPKPRWWLSCLGPCEQTRMVPPSRWANSSKHGLCHLHLAGAHRTAQGLCQSPYFQQVPGTHPENESSSVWSWPLAILCENMYLLCIGDRSVSSHWEESSDRLLVMAFLADL